MYVAYRQGILIYVAGVLVSLFYLFLVGCDESIVVADVNKLNQNTQLTDTSSSTVESDSLNQNSTDQNSTEKQTDTESDSLDPTIDTTDAGPDDNVESGCEGDIILVVPSNFEGIYLHNYDLPYFEGVMHLRQSLYIVGAQFDEKDLSVLKSLRYIDGGLSIFETRLRNLDFLSNLKQVGGNLAIRSNDELTDIEALKNISLKGETLAIVSNESLSTCSAIDFATLISDNGWEGEPCVYDNMQEKGCEDLDKKCAFYREYPWTGQAAISTFSQADVRPAL